MTIRCPTIEGHVFDLSCRPEWTGPETTESREAGRARDRAKQTWEWLRPFRERNEDGTYPVVHQYRKNLEVRVYCLLCGDVWPATGDHEILSAKISFQAQHSHPRHQSACTGLRPTRLPCHRMRVRRIPRLNAKSDSLFGV